MLKRLIRWQRWRASARYWRAQAESAQKEVARLQLSLLAERYRNMQREDTFASAAIMGQRGMWGVAPRNGPALMPDPVKPKPPSDPYALSGADLLEFEQFWNLDRPAHVSEAEAKRKFFTEVVLPRRRPLNDDPYGAN